MPTHDAKMSDIAPEQLDWVAGGAGSAPAPKPMPPSTQCWSTRSGGLACMSEGDVKVN